MHVINLLITFTYLPVLSPRLVTDGTVNFAADKSCVLNEDISFLHIIFLKKFSSCISVTVLNR